MSTGFKELADWAASLGVDQHPSEIHGLVTGWVCAGSKWTAPERLSTLQDWLSVNLADADSQLLDQVFEETLSGLKDQELGFQPLLPGEDQPVNERTQAIALWCSGFLTGFGMTGRYQQEELAEDVREVFTDLARIASFAEDVPEDDENEADLIEIAEYVRMSAMLVFTDCAQRAVH